MCINQHQTNQKQTEGWEEQPYPYVSLIALKTFEQRINVG